MFGFEASQAPKASADPDSSQVIDLTDDQDTPMLPPPPPPKSQAKPTKGIKLSNCNLTSIRELRAELDEGKHHGALPPVSSANKSKVNTQS
jgi:hypothetical protein